MLDLAADANALLATIAAAQVAEPPKPKPQTKYLLGHVDDARETLDGIESLYRAVTDDGPTEHQRDDLWALAYDLDELAGQIRNEIEKL
jgi:hypothetical protein